MTGLPRLTQAMRSSNTLEVKRCLKPTMEDVDNLRLWREKILRRKPSWMGLRVFLQRRNYRKNWAQLNELLSNLRSTINDEIKHCGEAIVDDETIFVLCLFLDQSELTQKQIELLHCTIKQLVDETVIVTLYSIVYEISKILNLKCRLYIKEIGSNFFNICESNKWGHKIGCELPTVQADDDELKLLGGLAPDISIFSKTAKTFSMKYSKNMNEKSTDSLAKQYKCKATEMYSKSWLESRCGSDTLDYIVELLKSGRKNEELEYSILELVGFDRIEDVKEIIEGRCKILQKIELEEIEHMFKCQLKEEKMMVDGPCTMRVVLNSGYEKKLLKQIHKENKRVKLLERKKLDSDSDSN